MEGKRTIEQVIKGPSIEGDRRRSPRRILTAIRLTSRVVVDGKYFDLIMYLHSCWKK